MADSLIRLRVDSAEYNNKLKRASEELNRYADGCRKAGGTLEHVDEGVLEFTRSLGKMETVATSARGKLVEMTKAFTDMSLRYKNMTDEEKKGEYGKALSASLNELKGRIQDTKVQLEDINRELNGQKFGQFGGMIDNIGQKFGITGNLTEMLTSKTALMTAGIGASIAVITKATEAWAGYNAELAKQDQQTAVITGLKGDDAERMTDTMRALVDTYKVDFRQAVEAANTLMSQFGESGDSAISIIKDGMQGMIQGDGPKLLQMIQQYAPSFRDAGVSARQLVAVIQNSEGGIFTDQNMNAIVMGIKNIRLMTNQTSEALSKMGIDGQKMSEQLSNGSLTVFDALKQVSAQLKNVDSNSQTAGEVMQTVFGRQGAMAGTNLAKAIEQLNTNLEETKKQTGEVGEAFADLQTANEKLNVAIREAFSYDGWDEMVTGIRSKLITVLAEVIDKLGQIRSYFSGENNVDWNITPKSGVQNLADDPNVDDHGNYIVKPWNSKGMKVVQPTQPVTPIVPPKPTKTNTTTSSKRTQEYIPLEGSIDAQTKKVQDLQKAWRAVADDDSRKRIKEQVEQAQLVLDVLNGKTDVKDVEIRVNSDEALKDVEKIKGVKIEPKSFTVTADDDKAAEELKKLGAVQISDKTFSITANDADALKNIQAIEGVKIEPKSFTVTALTADALAALQTVNDVVIADKTFKIEPVVGQMPSVAMENPFERAQSGLQEIRQKVRLEIDKENLKADTDTLQTILKDAMQNGINTGGILDFQFTALGDEITKGINVPDDVWQGILDQYNELREQIGEEPIKIDFKTGNIAKEGEKTEKSWQAAAQAVQTVGSAMSSIEDPAAKVAGTIAQAIASIALGYAQATTQAATLGPWAWVAFAATGMAQMISMISAIHSSTGFANGGIVKGNSYSGDNVPALVDGSQMVGLNAGEVVLNKAAQSNLANQLQGNNMGNMRLVARVKGTDLLFSLENTLQMQGYGKIATWG